MKEDIVKAIRGRRLLRFVYKGHLRTVEPHTYGIDTRGQRVLCAYQVGGGSNSSAGGWRNFSEKEMTGMEALAERFAAPRPEYRQGDGLFKSIIAEL